MINLLFIDWPSDGLTMTVISLQFHYIPNLLKLSVIRRVLLGLKFHMLNTNLAFSTKLQQQYISWDKWSLVAKSKDQQSNAMLTHKWSNLSIQHSLIPSECFYLGAHSIRSTNHVKCIQKSHLERYWCWLQLLHQHLYITSQALIAKILKSPKR